MGTPGAGAMTSRERVLLELARRDKSDLLQTFQAITEAAAVVLDVARVSIWEIVNGPGDKCDTRLVCKDLYLMNEKRHVSFIPIHACDFPAYLRAIHERRTIAADDAQNDSRTRDFKQFYLQPLGITSMLDIPIWHHGEVYGVLCFEHIGPIRQWQTSEQSFAIHMADIAALSLEAAEVQTLQKRWEVVIDSMEEGVVVLDPRGSVIQSNRAAMRDFGDRAVTTTFEERVRNTEYVDATDRAIPKEDWPFMRAMRGEIIRGEICGFIVRDTGERRYLRLTCSPVTEDGVTRYVVAVGVDITEEMFFERLKRDLLAGLAHELKTPLAIAKGYAQQLRSAASLPPQWPRMLDAITFACDRMDHLSEVLLDVSSVIMGRLRLTHERVDFIDLTLSQVRRVEQVTPDRRIQVRVHAGAPAIVVVDCTRVGHAVRQVLENAIAYSERESTVEVDLSTSGGHVLLSVRDHGVGIPSDAQANVFRMFFKAHSGTAHDQGGLGVGLFLAREVLRRHGGDMWFESTEGSGATFFMKLPLAEPST